MKITYDPELNIAYIRFKNKRAQVRTVAVSDELNVDLAPDGSVYGLELLNARVQLAPRNAKNLTIVNTSSGKSAELPLAG